VAVASTILLNIEVRGIVSKLGRSYVTERALREGARVTDLVQREGELALRLADSAGIRAWMLDPSDEKLRREAFQELGSFKRAFLDSNWFVVVGDGRTYYNQPETGALAITTLEPNVPSDIWYFNTVKADKNISFNLDFNPLIGATKVWINCVVRSADGQVIGLAGTGLDITEVVKSLVSGGSDGASSMLVDANGAITAHPNAAYMEHNAKVWTSGKKITVQDLASTNADRLRLEALLAAARTGKMAVDEVSIAGHSGLTAVAPISEIGWMAVVSVETSTVISVADFLPLFVMVVVAMLVVLSLIAILMERMVLRPLSVMTDSARKVAMGDYDIVLPFSRKDEIGRLAGAFNRMTVQVKQHTGNLEILVTKRTGELSAANERLAETNRQVMESIRYARLIQNGIMPTETVLRESLAEYSLFHRQRDLVGGDFLFLHSGSAGFFVAAVDCEGHGVSGALMTMMADSFLKQITARSRVDDPAAVITELDDAIRAATNQSGLAIGLCGCLPLENSVVFAGAAMPLYVLEPDGTVSTLKGRPKSVGYRHGESLRRVENQRVDASGRAFFLVTDGIVDQDGPEDPDRSDHPGGGRSYGTTRLSSLVSACVGGSIDDNCPAWEKEFDRYRSGRPQRDDALAFAFRLRT